MRYLILLLFVSSLALAQGGVDYKNHDVGVINKHGWEFGDQRSFNGYLKNYYTAVSDKVSDSMPEAAATVTNNGSVIVVNPYKFTNEATDGAAVHIMSSYGHIRPAIVRMWGEGDE